MTYDRTQTESQQLLVNHRGEVPARGLEYGFSNCHGEEVSRDQAETRIYRHKGQELNTCLFSGMSQIFVTGEEQAPKPKVTPLFPKRSKQAQTTEVRNPTGRNKQQRDRSPGSQEHGPDSSKPFSQDRSPQKWRNPWEQKFPTESQEKQSKVSEAAGGQDQKHMKEKGARILACSLGLFTNTNGRGKSREKEERFGDEHNRHRDSSGAWRPIWRAGPRGEFDAP